MTDQRSRRNRMGTKNKTRGDVGRMIGVSGGLVAAIVGVMMFSPLAAQYDESGVVRGDASTALVDSLMVAKDYPAALRWVDSCIAEKQIDLPRWAYFDRFKSEEERYKISSNRAELYDLQWTRINILREMGEKKALEEALHEYSGIIGYNQEQAKEMLEQMKGGKG